MGRLIPERTWKAMKAQMVKRMFQNMNQPNLMPPPEPRSRMSQDLAKYRTDQILQDRVRRNGVVR